MRAPLLISFLWIQIAFAQINPSLLNGFGYQQNLPARNILFNQQPQNNGLPLNNPVIRPIYSSLKQTPNVVQNLPISSNIVPNNLQIANGLSNFLASNGLTNLPQQNFPVTNCGNQRNQQLNLPNNIQYQTNYGSLSGNLPMNNLLLNNLPISNLPLNNLPVSNLPISNNYQINNLPVSNLPVANNFQFQNNLNNLINNYASANIPQVNSLVNPNLSKFNNLQANNFITSRAANVQIPNNIQVPLVNNAQLFNQAPLGNNLVSANYQQNIPNFNNLRMANVPVNYNSLPNNLPISNYNLGNAVNTNYLANVNNLQSNSALLNNFQLANQPIVNNIQSSNRLPGNNNYPVKYNIGNAANTNYLTNVNNLQSNSELFNKFQLANQPLVNNIQNSNTLPVNNNLYNSIPNVGRTNIGQTLMQPSIGNPNLQLTNPSISNGCGCKSNSLFLLDDNVANSLPSTPVFSLNGLQLGQLGKLPLFNGLPVIGMTESIVNLQPL